jgi:hypothetical protein
MENLSVSFVITRLDVWLSVFIWHHSTHELNVTLQQVNHLINEMFDKQRSRESFDSENCNCDQTIWHTTQFCERKHSVKRKKFSFINKNSKYTQSINQSINLFSVSFDINVETTPAEFQISMTDLQCDTNLRNIFRRVRLSDFYKRCLCAANDKPFRKHLSSWTVLLKN